MNRDCEGNNDNYSFIHRRSGITFLEDVQKIESKMYMI